MITANRYHDISCGHRVVGHENKCSNLHGHNYRVHFYVQADELDKVGRVLDFGIIKTMLCMWLEKEWDHKFLMWKKDPMIPTLTHEMYTHMVIVPFNPTAENMAQYLCEVIAPAQLQGTGCTLIKCTIEETRKCSATYEIKD